MKTWKLAAWTVATLVMTENAFALGWARSFAMVGLLMLVGLAVLEILLRLMGHKAPEDEGDDDGGTEKHPPGAFLLERPPKTPPKWRA